MKNLIYSLILVSFVFAIASCDKDEDDHPEYIVTIDEPNASDKEAGETMHIHVIFEEKDGGTIENVNVQIANKADGTVIYTGPASEHVHETSGKYEYVDDLVLAVEEDTEWILTASAWGGEDHEDEDEHDHEEEEEHEREHETSVSVEFHVH